MVRGGHGILNNYDWSIGGSFGGKGLKISKSKINDFVVKLTTRVVRGGHGAILCENMSRRGQRWSWVVI